MKATPVIERILRRVEIDPTTGCWLWTGYKVRGYGSIGWGPRDAKKSSVTHRFVWAFYNGPVPEGLDLDHLCRNRACCNPDHLEPVTRQENARRGLKYRPQACPKGHAYTPENSMFTRAGYLRCRECNRAWCRKTYDRIRVRNT